LARKKVTRVGNERFGLALTTGAARRKLPAQAFGGRKAMPSRCVCRLIAGLAAGWIAIPEGAAQPYVGLGPSRLSLSSEYSAIDARSGTGFTLIGGIEFAPTGFAELSVSAASVDVGPTENIFYPADRAEYSILRFGIGKSLWALGERGWTPWVGAGWAYHYVNWESFYYQVDGTGVSLGAGVDIEPVRPWRVRVQAMRHRFSGRDTYGYGPFGTRSGEWSAVVIYGFR
jgi:opacity protein-like surface antigen